MQSFEQEIQDFLTKYNIRFIDGTNSLEELDFALPEYNIHFDVKEKKQHFNMSNWEGTNIPEEYFFILDDLAARKILLKAPRSFVLIRDSVRTPVYYVFSIVDLLCIPKKRVRRALEKNARTFKGKWLIDFRHAMKFDSLEDAVKYMVTYPKQYDKIFKEQIDCWGEYENENIQTAGIPRKPEHWEEDLKVAKS
ncbi:MAG: hypothetical protein HYZ34_11680 [Ignavibacteriae bacterium]|nr:hypothetical protein [Ignavibacteriota bacterium]